MKTGRKPLLNETQREFIWNNHTLGTEYLGRLFQVSGATVLRVKGEKGLQDKRYIGGKKKPKIIKVEKKPKNNYRAKSSQYDRLNYLAKNKGCRNVTEAIKKYGRKNLVKELNQLESILN